MYTFILLKSFQRKKARYILPTIALIIGIAVGSSLLMVSIDVEEKLEMESKKLGPNLIAVPHSDDIKLSIGGVDLGSVSSARYMSEANARMITDLPLDVYGGRVCQKPTINGYLYNVMKYNNNTDIIVGGTWFDKVLAMNAWWEVDGSFPEAPNEIVVGRVAAEKLNTQIGEEIELVYSEIVSDENGDAVYYTTRSFVVSGILTAGGEDDSRIFAPPETIQNMTGLPGKVSLLHISTLCATCDVDAVAEIIEQYVPDIEVQTIKQVTHAAQETLNLVQNLVGFITGVAVLTSVLAVMTTMSLSVMERRKEIGLMKTIGAYDANIAFMFMSEGLIIAIVGGALGCVGGIFLAQLLGNYAFGADMATPLWIPLVCLGSAIGIVLLASVLPIRKALSVDPVVVLRGD